MNDRAHWLSLFSAVMHLTIGVPELLRIGPRFLPPSWAVIYAVVPSGEWIYPGLFVLTGLVAGAGIRLPGALWLGFRMSAGLFLAWGVAGIYAWWAGVGGNVPGFAANLYIAGAVWVVAHYVTLGLQGDEINDQVARLAEKVYQADGHDLAET